MAADPLNPQHEQMTHESMLRTLSYQAQAIWPQEKILYERYTLPQAASILDLGCGSGEGTVRLAEIFPHNNVTGVDLEESLLVHARTRAQNFGDRVRFEQGNGYNLTYADGSFDLVACRHLVQITPEPERIFSELVRVTRPGGWVHLLSEDYGMIYFHPTRLDNSNFWYQGPIKLGESMNTRMKIGRESITMALEAGLEEVSVDYIIVDTVRVPRDIFIGIWEAWRDGYTEVIAQHTSFSVEEVADHWQDMLDCLRNPSGYAAWHIPVISGRRPTG